jgi:hypothetical protein
LTLTKNLDVPRIGPPLDVDDTPRRDRLVVEYNTSTNPVENGAVRDTSGRGNDGVFYGGAVYDATQKALVFDGTASDQFVHTLKNGRSESGNIDYSVSLWFNPTTVNVSRWRAIFAIGVLDRTQPTDNNGDEITLFVKSGDNVLHLQNGGSSFDTTDTVQPGQWVHIVVTYDGTNRKIYLDGSLSISNGYTSINLPKEMLIRLAQSIPNNGEQDEYMDCKISNFKTWFGAALTTEEVKTLYDMGRCDEGHHVVNFSKTRVGIGLGDGEVPRRDLDVRGRMRVGTGLHNIQPSASSGTGANVPTLEVSDSDGSRANPLPTVLQITNALGGGSDWSLTDPFAKLAFATVDASGPGDGGVVGSIGMTCTAGGGGDDSRIIFATDSGVDHSEKMCITKTGRVGIGITNPPAKLYVKTTGSASMGGSWNTTDFVVSHGVGYNAPSQSLGVAMGVDGTGDVSTSRGYLWCMRPNQSWNTLKIQGNKLELIGLTSVTLNGGANVTSDDRLKTEEEFLQNALPTIMKLKPQTYRKHPFLPNDPSKEVTENMTEMPSDLSQLETGLIVQDIWYDAPELRHLVKLGDNANPPEVRPVDPDPNDPTQDPDYSSWGTTPTTLGYQGVFVVALKAIQELNTELQAERVKVTTLESQLASVLTRLDALESA